jgi:hypothetical protein
MPDERTIARYRRWYGKLLRCYSRPYRERFAESMEQTFNDLCRERAKAGKGLLGFVLWVFVETAVGIIREKVASIMTHSIARRLLVWAAAVALILMVPFLAMRFDWTVYDPGSPTPEKVNWTLADFIFAAVVLYGSALTYELVARIVSVTAYRVAVGVACATGLVLVWINAAAGIIGDGPVNLLYLGVIVVGFVGAWIARFQPRDMAWALVATAITQMLVPVIALAIWKAGWENLLMDGNSPHPPFHPGVGPVFVLNGFFAILWIASAFLFRRASAAGPGAPLA